MPVKTEKFTISTKGFDDIIDISKKVSNIVSIFNIKDGLINISTTASNASILILDSSVNFASKLPVFLDKILPADRNYDDNYIENNSDSNLKAALLSKSVSIPVINNELQFDKYGAIVLIDFDSKPRIRQVVVCGLY